AVVAFQRQYVGNIGTLSTACLRTSRTVRLDRYFTTSSSAKLCTVPSDSTIESSSAAACSSKLKRRQKRLRSDSPHALLMREPYVECTTRWLSPVSSKKRSSTIRSCVGSPPSAAFAAAR